MNKQNKLPKVLQWWVTPKLPLYYLEGDASRFLKIWLVHPIVRRIAKVYLWLLRNFFGVKVIGITGSVGKTTTKEMIVSILKQLYPVQYSFANIDPVYNIPKTILKTSPATQFLVLEMGVEYPGDMDFYLWMAKLDIGVLTNIYWTHTEFLGGIEGVASEKGKMIASLNKNSLAVVNADDSRAGSVANKAKARTILYGRGNNLEVRATDVKLTNNLQTEFRLWIGKENIDITLPVLGEHWVYAALAAAAVCRTREISLKLIKSGLEKFEPAPHRMVPIILKGGVILLDDTYNSNPLGAKAAITTLASVGKGRKKIAVLGDMLELGEYTEKGHREVGAWAAKKRIDLLLCVGEYAHYFAEGAKDGGMSKSNVVEVADKNEALKFLLPPAIKKSVILFKASRKIGLEELVSNFNS